jgi:hypothetical protein
VGQNQAALGLLPVGNGTGTASISGGHGIAQPVSPGFPPRRPGFEPRLGHVRFVVDRVAQGQVFSEWPTYQVDSVSPHPKKLKKNYSWRIRQLVDATRSAALIRPTLVRVFICTHLGIRTSTSVVRAFLHILRSTAEGRTVPVRRCDDHGRKTCVISQVCDKVNSPLQPYSCCTITAGFAEN